MSAENAADATASTSSPAPAVPQVGGDSSAPAAAAASTQSSAPKPPKNARGRPTDDPDTRWSKTLSYILRHGAAKEGLKLRSDGFVRVEDLVSLGGARQGCLS